MLKVTFVTRDKRPLLPRGHVVAWDQMEIPIQEEAARADISGFGTLQMEKDDAGVTIRGDHFTLKFDKERKDKYDRVLAYLYTDKGVHINLEIVRSGWAETTNRWPFVKYPEFHAAEKEAIEALRGIRTQVVCVPGTVPNAFHPHKYHPCGCKHLAKSKNIRRMTRATAKKRGYQPCSTILGK